MSFNIVLCEPQIPQNTGNIARTCAATGSNLHIIKPTGFEITDKNLKRAGLDYWHLVDVRVYPNWEEFFRKTAENPNREIFFLSTRGRTDYTEIRFPEEAYFVFGRETAGLPQSLLDAGIGTCLRIPMREGGARSLNLSNAAAIIAYEYMRQKGFTDLK